MIPGSQNREDVTLAPPKASTALTSLVVFVVDFVTRGLFIPNNLERDEATRIEPADKDQLGDSFANVSPLREFAGVEVVEGVY